MPAPRDPSHPARHQLGRQPHLRRRALRTGPHARGGPGGRRVLAPGPGARHPALLQRPVRHRGHPARPVRPGRRAGARRGARTVRVAGGTTYGEVAVHLQAPRLGPGQHGVAAAHLGRRRGRDRNPRLGRAATAVLAAAVGASRWSVPDGELRTRPRGDAGLRRRGRRARGARAVVTPRPRREPTYEVAQDLYDDLRWSEVVERDRRGRWPRLQRERLRSLGRRRRRPRSWSSAASTDAVGGRAPAWADGVAALGADAPFRSLGEGHLHARWASAGPVVRAAAALPRRPPAELRRGDPDRVVRARRRAGGALRAVTRLAAASRGELGALLTSARSAPSAPTTSGSRPAQGRESVALHFTWRREPAAVLAMAASRRAGPGALRRPPALGQGARPVRRLLYPRLADFRALAERVDPHGASATPPSTGCWTGPSGDRARSAVDEGARRLDERLQGIRCALTAPL